MKIKDKIKESILNDEAELYNILHTCGLSNRDSKILLKELEDINRSKNIYKRIGHILMFVSILLIYIKNFLVINIWALMLFIVYYFYKNEKALLEKKINEIKNNRKNYETDSEQVITEKL